jgi:hypothetical protein
MKSTLDLVSFQDDFSKLPIEKQAELIESDVFRLIIRFVHNRIKQTEFLEYVAKFRQLEVLSVDELNQFIISKARWEAHQYSFGKNQEEKKLVKDKLMELFEELSS